VRYRHVEQAFFARGVGAVELQPGVYDVGGEMHIVLSEAVAGAGYAELPMTINSAPLPTSYDAAKAALAECARTDECWERSCKMEALHSMTPAEDAEHA
jgi:hypothetical protein